MQKLTSVKATSSCPSKKGRHFAGEVPEATLRQGNISPYPVARLFFPNWSPWISPPILPAQHSKKSEKKKHRDRILANTGINKIHLSLLQYASQPRHPSLFLLPCIFYHPLPYQLSCSPTCGPLWQ